MTTATLPRRLFRPVATPPARRSMLIGFLATLIAGMLGVVLLSVGIGIASEGQVLSGVRVGGVMIGGLDREAAREQLVEQLPSLSAGRATITAGGVTETVTYAEVGRDYDLDTMLASAFEVGRNADPVADGLTRLRALVHQTELPVVVRPFEDELLDEAANRVASSVTIDPVEAAVSGESFEVHPSSEGRVLEADAVRAALVAPLTTTSPDDASIELAVATVAPAVTTEEATAAAEAARSMVADLALTIPGAGDGEGADLVISADTISSWISFGPEDGDDYAVQLDREAASTAIAELTETVNRDAVSATFGVAGAGLGGVIPGQEGRELDVEGSTSALMTALEERAGGAPVASLALAVNVTQPALTTAAAEEILPQMQMVSSWTTNYVPGDGNGYGANISIPAWDLDGTNLAPGEWFSFWGGIGPVTVERGYQYGGAIINGRSVAMGALAGGICSTSTTLFNAAMRFGLEIGERTAHYYYIDRYPTGLDATVAIVDDSVTDMTFRNDTEHPIVIRGFGTPGQVTFQLWGVPNGRTVALSDPIIANRRSATETTQVDTSMAPGTAKRVEYPHDGFQSTVSRTVYDRSGNVLHQNTWFSDYRVVNGITLVGPTAAAPPAEDSGATAAVPPGDGPPVEEPPEG